MIGAMRHRIVLERKTPAGDGAGGLTQTWTPFATVWARVEGKHDRERLDAQKIETKQRFEIVLRHRGDIGTDDRIIFGELTLNILSIADLSGLGKHLHILCETV